MLRLRAMRRRQEFLALAVALALHTALLGFVRLTTGDRTSDASRPVPSRSEISWDLELEEAATEGAVVERRDPPNGFDRLPGRASRRPAENEPPLVSLETEADVVPEGTPELEAEVEDPVPSRPIDLGLGPNGWQRFVTAPKNGEAPRAERAAPRKNRFQVFRAPPVSTTGGLQEGLEARDRELGLGPSGRVLSALHSAAHTTVAPEVGVARFAVTVHRTGTVDVTLDAASGQVERWKKVAAHVASALRSAPPKIRPPRERLELVVELVAEATLPNGTKAKSLEKPHLDAPPLKFQSTEAAIDQVKRENPTTKNPTPDGIAIKLDTPGLYLAETGEVVSYRVGVGSISPGYQLGAAVGPVAQGSFDPTHIGAKPQRMVRTRVVAESMF